MAAGAGRARLIPMFRTQLETFSAKRVAQSMAAQSSQAPPSQRSTLTTAGRVVRRLASFVGWLLGGFGLVKSVRNHFRAGRAGHGAGGDEIVVYCVHRSFFLWALILTGFIGAASVRHWPGSAGAWGWIYTLVLIYTLLTLLFDVGSLKALLWGGIFCFVWLGSLYLEDLKHVTALSGVGRYLGHLHPSLDPGFAAVVSWLLLIPWLGAMFHSFSRGRKTFSPNSIEEWYLGEGREITDRSGLKFRSRYRDLFETTLGFGAGDLEAVDGNHHVVKRWENILFLALLWKRLDLILHQRAAVVDMESKPSEPGARAA